MLLHQCRKRTEAIKYSHEGEVRVPGYFSEEAGIIKGAKAPDGSEKPTFKGLGPEDDADPAAQRALSRMWLPIVLVGNKSDQKTARKVQVSRLSLVLGLPSTNTRRCCRRKTSSTSSTTSRARRASRRSHRAAAATTISSTWSRPLC